MYFRKMNFLKIILSPFSIVYSTINALRNSFFERGLLKIYKSSIKVISVGNISMGGTGKTPHVAYIINLLKSSNTAVISRGYGRKAPNLIEGDSAIHTASDLGDEPMELLSKFEGAKFKMISEANRTKALHYLERQKTLTEFAILDDGFQHRYVDRDLNILLSDYNNLFYNDFVVPQGTLRESRQGVKRADLIIVTKCEATISELERSEIKSKISKFTQVPICFSTINYKGFTNKNDKSIQLNKSYLLITGIAKPQLIHQYLSSQNINFEALTFGDHHDFSTKEIERIAKKSKLFDGIITTEKDWMRLKDTELQNHSNRELFRLNIEVTIIGEQDRIFFNKQITKL